MATIFSIAAIVYDHKIYWYESLVWLLLYCSYGIATFFDLRLIIRYVAVVGIGRYLFLRNQEKGTQSD